MCVSQNGVEDLITSESSLAGWVVMCLLELFLLFSSIVGVSA